MPLKYPTFQIDTRNPDPTVAINAFLWTMAKARELGMMPKTEHQLAAELLSGDARCLFYSNSGGVQSIVMDDDALSDDDAFEMIIWIAERQKKRRKEKREAAFIGPRLPEVVV